MIGALFALTVELGAADDHERVRANYTIIQLRFTENIPEYLELRIRELYFKFKF